MHPAERIPVWLTYRPRPFPDANLLLLHGPEPVLVDSGFVGHAKETADWARVHAGAVCLVVNTNWHADHVGGNGLLQAQGAGIVASAPDAQAVARRDAGCCLAEYLDQPVAPYTVDKQLSDGEILTLGETAWQVMWTPGHTPGHLSLWQPDDRILVTGDALSDYDVGWVNRALDGEDAAAVAVASLRRLADLAPRIVLPAHGPLPTDPSATFAKSLERAQRLVDDPDGAVWYAARRIFGYALMIRGGVATAAVEPYLHERVWLRDAARLLRRTPEDLATELVSAMLATGAVVRRDARLHAVAEHTDVDQRTLAVPFPRDWPDPPARTAADASVDNPAAPAEHQEP